MTYDELLAKLKAPQTLEDFGDSLDQIECELRSGPDFWAREQGLPFEESCIAVLLTRTRFYVLVLAAQHMLIRDLRRQLAARYVVQ